MIGEMGIYIAFVAVLASAILFVYSTCYGRPEALLISRYTYYTHTTGVIVASSYLLYALLGHKFQYYYVYAYTDRALELKYLISAFWAGQEGTILFWALIGSLVGLLIIRREKELQAPVMAFICAGQFFLLFFLVVESPFRLLAQLPPDGAGLNPLLQDPWMAIHPPVVFMGYALLLVPYAFAAAALWKKDYQGWTNKALPWTLAGWLLLGAGIFIGGYWAYRVLGWGGYWSWDPVENASLVPWLTAAALVHGLLLQKRLGRPLRSNFLFATATFVLVIYATFLTRSGVLADFSVHSFAETPLTNYLAAFLFIFLLAGLGLLLLRYRELQTSPQKNQAFLSPYWLYTGGIVMLLCSAGFIALGTSSPLITTFLGQPAAVDESFYTRTTTPLAILILLLLGLTPYLNWQNESAVVVLKKTFPAGMCGLLGAVVAVALDVKEPYAILFVFAGLFGLAAALQAAYHQLWAKGLRFSCAHLAHAGVAMLLLGVLASMGYSSSEVISLTPGESKEALGYNLTYVQRINGHDDECTSCDTDRQIKDTFEVELVKGDKHLAAYPRMYIAGREARLMREPFVLRHWWGDLYLSPLELQQHRGGMLLDITAGEQYSVGDMEVHFSGFEVPGHKEKMEVGALLKISYEGESYTLMPVMFHTNNHWDSTTETTPDGGMVMLESFNPDTGIAYLRFVSFAVEIQAQDVLIIELSRKPLIPVLTAGTIFIMVGTLLACWRRFAVNTKKACGKKSDGL